MAVFLWDSSGLGKRYAFEPGTPTVRTLFDLAPAPDMAVAYICYAETASILCRKRNQQQLSPQEYVNTRVLLANEVLNSSRFTLLSVSDEDILAGVELSDTHNINSTDAAMLAAYLRYAEFVSEGDPHCVLVAADTRLLRAGEAEGLQTLNPETLTPEELPAFLDALS